eukprot:CAMPEP_0201508246 /NCGR_PEP_ID=MMETSP0161_2-20130828/1669_1 /ASSEMBLY_ACC=CAM_ASM_000251 /TAXON_ID=180227 /ORGANISM="Neoparamoeba aestuarina, Strain SoJaBio B1-5/56/2" /LENGTH=32 /DNA_ID= /DNA_START= /DNA_END= /DNA_ORIENTATION=
MLQSQAQNEFHYPMGKIGFEHVDTDSCGVIPP